MAKDHNLRSQTIRERVEMIEARIAAYKKANAEDYDRMKANPEYGFYQREIDYRNRCLKQYCWMLRNYKNVGFVRK